MNDANFKSAADSLAQAMSIEAKDILPFLNNLPCKDDGVGHLISSLNNTGASKDKISAAKLEALSFEQKNQMLEMAQYLIHSRKSFLELIA